VRPYLKITRAKRAGGMAQAVEYLSFKTEALSSNPSTTKKKERKKFTVRCRDDSDMPPLLMSTMAYGVARESLKLIQQE
jgi:hypothetical protein